MLWPLELSAQGPIWGESSQSETLLERVWRCPLVVLDLYRMYLVWASVNYVAITIS